MSDIIHLLPDSIANQIAAGEVIQRPASVVKELVENAIDAGANSIQIAIKDAGRTLIQVIDNGKGMSATDARMAFERHATSKIQKADDLFSLRTMGFRGEALPSIAAIAQLELRTKTEESEVGSLLCISGSKVEKQEIVTCTTGTNISVKNIFFNVPARRKFLKSNDTERRNILVELERIALVHPDIDFTFLDNDIVTLQYPACNLRQRVINVVGKNFNQQLISLEVETSLVKINGFVGKPESARKTRAQQFFFVNGRYMRHPYFAKAIQNAFEPLIPNGEHPNFFIYLEVDPSTIDVNIHPTKTEIKFENEKPIWQILFAATKEALGKFNEVPSIDFDTKDAVDIPIHDTSRFYTQPKVNVNPSYNPFKTQSAGGGGSYQRPKLDWEQFYEGFEKEKPTDDIMNSVANKKSNNTLFRDYSKSTISDKEEINSLSDFVVHYQYKNKYILTSAKSGLMIIDQHRAHIRILFDQFISQILNQKGTSQRCLFPEMIELSPSESAMIPYIVDDLDALGFDLSNLGNNYYSINGVPSETTKTDSVKLIHKMLTESIDSGTDVKEELREKIALSMAQAASIPYGQNLSEEEMIKLVDQLFSSPSHKYTPDGKTIISMLSDDVIDKMFK